MLASCQWRPGIALLNALQERHSMCAFPYNPSLF
ncbi:protein of unknown function (plasmid) [Azospirillum baldaniorum]|uniref:Uncharacterized protein n=1 Tax=Azospirillum baldaniorum TaxID=1064539 RepID=A0A9P1JXH6_9PROT|nr:protein of unknown function [Azospirillum baldaniorum]